MLFLENFMTLTISKDTLCDGEFDQEVRIKITNVTDFSINRTRKLLDDGLTWIKCDLIVYRTPETNFLGDYEYVYDKETLHVHCD